MSMAKPHRTRRMGVEPHAIGNGRPVGNRATATSSFCAGGTLMKVCVIAVFVASSFTEITPPKLRPRFLSSGAECPTPVMAQIRLRPSAFNISAITPFAILCRNLLPAVKVGIFFCGYRRGLRRPKPSYPHTPEVGRGYVVDKPCFPHQRRVDSSNYSLNTYLTKC